MKQIFNDIRKEIDIHSDEACFIPDDMMVIPSSWMLKLLDESEAKWNTTEAEIRAKAQREIVEQLELELSESIIWSMLADFSKDKTFDYTSEKIVDYVIGTAKRVAEQLKGE